MTKRILCLTIDSEPEANWRETYDVHRKHWEQCFDACPWVDGYFVRAEPNLAETYVLDKVRRRFTFRGGESSIAILYKVAKAIDVLLNESHGCVVRTGLSSLYDFKTLRDELPLQNGTYAGHFVESYYVSGAGMVLSPDAARALVAGIGSERAAHDDIAVQQILKAKGILPKERPMFVFDYAKGLDQLDKVKRGEHLCYRFRDYKDPHRVREREVMPAVFKMLYAGDETVQVRRGEEPFFAAYEPSGTGSGVGSSAEYTAPMRDFINKFLQTHDIKTVVDYACGDWQWAKLVDWGDRTYYGFDIVPNLIKKLSSEYGSEHRKFELLRESTELPSCDLIICKDLCIHLPVEDIAELARKFAAKAKHILWINTVGTSPWLPPINAQIERGKCRPVDMGAKPFYLPGAHVMQWGRRDDTGIKSVFHQETGRVVYRFGEIERILALGALPDRFSGYVAGSAQDTAIPRSIHFIWIGSELPEKYRRNVLTYVRNNPSYAVTLWTDRPCVFDEVKVRRLDELPMRSRAIYDAETNWGAKADVARYEIVLAEGGIYCDIDSVSLRPFDAIFERAFVSSVLHTWNNVSNAAFGFPKGSPLLEFVLRSMPLARGGKSVPERTGPTFFTTCLLSARDESIQFVDQSVLIQRTTGGYTYHTNDANWAR